MEDKFFTEFTDFYIKLTVLSVKLRTGEPLGPSYEKVKEILQSIIPIFDTMYKEKNITHDTVIKIADPVVVNKDVGIEEQMSQIKLREIKAQEEALQAINEKKKLDEELRAINEKKKLEEELQAINEKKKLDAELADAISLTLKILETLKDNNWYQICDPENPDEDFGIENCLLNNGLEDEEKEIKRIEIDLQRIYLEDVKVIC